MSLIRNLGMQISMLIAAAYNLSGPMELCMPLQLLNPTLGINSLADCIYYIPGDMYGF